MVIFKYLIVFTWHYFILSLIVNFSTFVTNFDSNYMNLASLFSIHLFTSSLIKVELKFNACFFLTNENGVYKPKWSWPVYMQSILEVQKTKFTGESLSYLVKTRKIGRSFMWSKSMSMQINSHSSAYIIIPATEVS